MQAGCYVMDNPSLVEQSETRTLALCSRFGNCVAGSVSYMHVE